MLSDARFYTFLERTVANKFGRDVLQKLKAEQEKEDAVNNAVEAIQAEDSLPATPVKSNADVSSTTDEDKITEIV
jgi:hypothetical protein